jgi:hypothetical protein
VGLGLGKRLGVSRHESRIRRLEERAKRRRDAKTGFDMSEPIDPDMVAVLDASMHLKGGGKNQSRGGVPVPAYDRVADVYGPNYTREQEHEVATRIGLAERGYTEEEIDELVPAYLEFFADAREGDT